MRLAVLYGSLARGDEDEGSDVDLLVSLTDDRPHASTQLGSRLQRLIGRHVDIAVLERVQANAPLLLDQVLNDGRVLIDRDEQWQDLLNHRPQIHARALHAHRSQMTKASRAIEELTG